MVKEERMVLGGSGRSKGVVPDGPGHGKGGKGGPII